jgi:hypothetical protein
MMKKWIIRISAVIAVIFVLLLVLPFMFKGKILSAAQKTASESVTATISFDEDLSLSLIRNFPNLSVGVNNIRVIGQDSFQNDTLFQAKQIRLTLDLASLFSETNPINIKKIYAREPRIFVHVLKSGRANYDIVPYDSTGVEAPIDTSAAPMSLNLNNIDIENAYIHYKDVSMGIDFLSAGTDFQAKGDFAKDIFTLASHFQAKSLNLSYEGMTLVSKAVFDLKSDIQMDLEKFRFGFEPLTARLNELPLEMRGWVQMNDENMDMDLKIDVPNSEFKSLLSAVPGCYTSDFKNVNASGKMSFKMAIKGIMDDLKMPQTKIDLAVENAQFQYPDLPKSVSGINVDLHVLNEDGDPDHTTVDLKNFSLLLGKDPFKMNLFTKNPISSPYARGALSANLTLNDWKDMLPLDSGVAVSGNIKTGVVFDGHYASVTQEKFDDLKVEGSLGLTNFRYSAPDLLATEINTLDIKATPSAFVISPSTIRYGSSSVEITEGRLTNMLGYALHKETLSGTLRINSKRIDLNEWMPTSETTSQETEESSDTAALSAPQIPLNIDMVFQGKIGELLYEDYQLKNCEAQIAVKEGKLNINPIKAEMWGSQISFSTNYAYFEGGKPHINGAFSLQNLIPKNISSNFKMLNTYAPILKDLDAPFNLNMEMISDLGEDLSVDMQSVSADGLMAVTQAQNLKSPEWLKQVFEQLKWNKSKLGDVKIKPGKLGFAINDGKLSLKDSIRLDVYEGAKMSFSGNVDLAQNINFNGFFYTQGKAIPMSITGTTTSPKLRIDWKQLGLKVVEEYKEKAVAEVKKEVNKVADKAIVEAEAQAAKLRSETKEKADQLRSEGKNLAEKTRKETDKLVQVSLDKTKAEIDASMAKARNPLEKIAAEKIGKKLNEEAQKKSEKLRREGYEKADKIESEANAKAETLEKETDRRAQKLIDDAKAQQQAKLK